MPPIRSLASERRAYIVTVILLLGEIMPIYSCYAKKKLVCVVITAPSRRQPFSCSECIKANTYSLCDMCLVFTNKYTF